MAGCIGGIAKEITSTCETSKVGGLEVVAWAFNRKDLEITYSATEGEENLITSLANATAKIGYRITGVKKLLNCGHDIVVADDRPNKYTHFFALQGFEFDQESEMNMDDLDDLVIIVERKDKADDGDGVFNAYGCKYGLFKSADSARANDINGARNIELMSLGGQEEPVSKYIVLDTDYTNTLALIESLMSLPT
jgi:hypothetical protein